VKRETLDPSFLLQKDEEGKEKEKEIIFAMSQPADEELYIVFYGSWRISNHAIIHECFV
jgi:hypothetical protein